MPGAVGGRSGAALALTMGDPAGVGLELTITAWQRRVSEGLAPFAYFGIHDGLDLRDIPWKRGRGYDIAALSNLVTANDVWANVVISQCRESRSSGPSSPRSSGATM